MIADGAPGAATAHEVDVDPEALFLCAAMWNNDTVLMTRLFALVGPYDFDCATHSRLFECIKELIELGSPHDATSVLAVLRRSGAVGQRDSPLRRALADVATAGAAASGVLHYADLVLSQSYRRSFYQAGVRIQQAAEECAEDDLFVHLVEVGRAQRIAMRRLQSFRSEDWTMTRRTALPPASI